MVVFNKVINQGKIIFQLPLACFTISTSTSQVQIFIPYVMLIVSSC